VRGKREEEKRRRGEEEKRRRGEEEVRRKPLRLSVPPSARASVRLYARPPVRPSTHHGAHV
jgi:hypothetical protein